MANSILINEKTSTHRNRESKAKMLYSLMNKVKDVYKDCKAAVELLDFGKKRRSATHTNNVRK